MFETETWDDNHEQEQPHVSALTWAVAKSQSEQKQKKQKKNKSKEKQNLVENSRDEQNGLLKKSNKLKTKARRLGISVENPNIISEISFKSDFKAFFLFYKK